MHQAVAVDRLVVLRSWCPAVHAQLQPCNPAATLCAILQPYVISGRRDPGGQLRRGRCDGPGRAVPALQGGSFVTRGLDLWVGNQIIARGLLSMWLGGGAGRGAAVPEGDA
eukprot:scaffold55942_cov45-Phaeocystis_antarctica.AAC.3